MRQALLVLLVANAVPLFGTLFLHWTVGSILALYWAESAVIGLVTLLQLWTAAPPRRPAPWWQRLPLSLFFVVHFGLFMLVHAVFAGLIAASETTGTLHGQRPANGPFDAVATLLSFLDGGTVYALAGLVLSHGISLVTNWWCGGERRRRELNQVMLQPYARVVVMHLVVLVGSALTVLTGAPQAVVALLVVAKTAADAAAHRRQHAAAPATGTPP